MKGFSRHAAIFAIICLGMAATASDARADLSGYSGDFSSFASLGNVSASTNTMTNLMPYMGHQIAKVGESPLRSAAAADFTFDTVGQMSSFFFVFSHDRNGSDGSYARSTGTLNFQTTATGLSTYSLQGGYGMSGFDGIRMQVVLTDLDDNTVLFANIQESSHTPDGFFFLGGEDGDDVNVLSGFDFGTLAAGHNFSLTYLMDIISGPSGQNADAGGFLELDIEPGLIPAPSAGSLGAIGLLLLAIKCRRIS